jgi:hypothetical protein
MRLGFSKEKGTWCSSVQNVRCAVTLSSSGVFGQTYSFVGCAIAFSANRESCFLAER